jgi:hypothetical protein
MTNKAYLSNLSDHWPLERQRELLGMRAAEYVDVLKPGRLERARDPKADSKARDKVLTDRAAMLAPSSRKAEGVLEVAAFPCLAVSTHDFLDVVARASARGMSLLEVSTGRQIAAGQGAEDLARAIPFFQAALRGRGLQTRTEHAAKLEEDGRKRALAVADLYKLPDEEMPLATVRERAGKDGKPMAPATLRKHLGPRKAAQRLYAAGLKRSATAAAKREQKESDDA